MVSAGRNANGTFSKGWKGGPGRPAKEVERDYLLAFRSACSPQDLAEVVATVLRVAKSGDMVAARLLLNYCLPLQARIDLFNHVDPEDAYRVAGSTTEEVTNEMLTRIVNKIKENRAYKAELANNCRPTDS